jgi:hypothetical protein
MYAEGPRPNMNIDTPARNIFDHIFLSQLTRLNFQATSSGYLYDGFKRDLVSLPIGLPELTYLRIFRGPVESYQHREYPEMLERIQRNRLPKLESLVLASRTHIFTGNELKVLGNNGWPNLSYYVCRALLISWHSFPRYFDSDT